MATGRVGDALPGSDLPVLAILDAVESSSAEIERTSPLCAELSLDHCVTVSLLFRSVERWRRADTPLVRLVRKEGRAANGRLFFLSSILQDTEGDGGSMTDLQLRDEALTLFLAGHETTAVGLTWTWYPLSCHPEAEARLHAELDDVIGGRLPGAADLPRLPYARMVLTEAMRLYPPAWIMGRQPLRAAKIRKKRGAYCHPVRGGCAVRAPIPRVVLAVFANTLFEPNCATRY